MATETVTVLCGTCKQVAEQVSAECGDSVTCRRCGKTASTAHAIQIAKAYTVDALQIQLNKEMKKISGSSSFISFTGPTSLSKSYEWITDV